VSRTSISVSGPAEAAAFAAARKCEAGTFISSRERPEVVGFAARRPTTLTSCQAADRIRWLGGRAAVGGSNCTASRQLHCLPADFALVGGSRRAASGRHVRRLAA